MNTIEFRVNRQVWEAFEASLEGVGKKFVRELAETLEVPSDELVKAVFSRSNKIPVCIHDWSDENIICNGYIYEGKVVVPCQNAKACGKEFCRNCLTNATKQNRNNDTLLMVERIEYEYDEDNCISDKLNTLWKNSDGTLYNSMSIVVGYYDEESDKLVIFKND